MNILYIVPSDFNSLEKKGVLNMILEKDEGGFFSNVLTLHPFTKYNRTINFKKNNKLVEYGWQFKINFLNKFFITKIIGTILIIFKLLFIFPFKLKKEKISVIRATDPYFMGLIGLFYSKLLNIPFVVSIHSDYEKRYELDGAKGSFTILGSRNFAKKLEKFVYKNCDFILPIRDYLKKYIEREFNISSDKVKVFPHGISFEKFDKTKFIDIYDEFSIPKDKKIISFVGRLSKENYVYDLIKISKLLCAKRDDFILLIVGEGNEYQNLKTYVESKHLQENIKLIGFQNKEIVVNVRKQSSISLCLMAGFSLIEACAASRPIIAYDVEWHYELVKNDKTGFLVKEGDIKDLVNKIDYLLTNYENANKMGLNARELSYKNHQLENTIKIKQSIYKKLLNI